MTWTDVPPAVDGWYWLRHEDGYVEAALREVGRWLRVGVGFASTNAMLGYYQFSAGPIEVPE